jgi:hypothetical protein
MVSRSKCAFGLSLFAAVLLGATFSGNAGPEPETLILLGAGSIGLAMLVLRRTTSEDSAKP